MIGWRLSEMRRERALGGRHCGALCRWLCSYAIAHTGMHAHTRKFDRPHIETRDNGHGEPHTQSLSTLSPHILHIRYEYPRPDAPMSPQV